MWLQLTSPARGALRTPRPRAIAAVVRAPDFSKWLAAARRRETKRAPAPAASALLAAALALPGMLPASAQAQAVADHGIIELKYLDYRDWQPGANRMTVRSPSLYTLLPLNDTTEFEGSLVYDAMSGASPLYHNTLSGASGLGVTDYRTAGDGKLTKYFNGWSLGVAGVVSSERDYLSRGGSVDVRIFSDDRNRTYAFGIGGANDRINPQNNNAWRHHQRAAQHARVPGRHHAGAVADADRPVEPDVLGWPRLLRRPVQAARQAAGRTQDLRVAHALQPVFRRARCRAAPVLPVPQRFVRQRLQHVHRRVGAGTAERVERDAGRSLLHTERRVVLSQSAGGLGLRQSDSRTRWTRAFRPSVRSPSA